MRLIPVTFRECRRFIAAHHRHNDPPHGWKFGVGLADDRGELIGVAVAGRPVARLLDDGVTLEATRVCTDGTPNANSMLYGALARAAQALGFERIVTYTLADESGSSLRAVGWEPEEQLDPRPGWDRPNRRRDHPTLLADEKQPTDTAKIRWVRQLSPRHAATR